MVTAPGQTAAALRLELYRSLVSARLHDAPTSLSSSTGTVGAPVVPAAGRRSWEAACAIATGTDDVVLCLPGTTATLLAADDVRRCRVHPPGGPARLARATGRALANRLRGSTGVVLCQLGITAPEVAPLLPVLSLAAVNRLPLVVVAPMAGPARPGAPNAVTAHVAWLRASGITVEAIGEDDGPGATVDLLAAAVARARKGDGPTWVEWRASEIGADAAGLRRLRAELRGHGWDDGALDRIEAALQAGAATAQDPGGNGAVRRPRHAASLTAGPAPTRASASAADGGAADGAVEPGGSVLETLGRLLAADADTVVVSAVDSRAGSTPTRSAPLADLATRYGAHRVLHLPLAAPDLAGLVAGLAEGGMRPVLRAGFDAITWGAVASWARLDELRAVAVLADQVAGAGGDGELEAWPAVHEQGGVRVLAAATAIDAGGLVLRAMAAGRPTAVVVSHEALAEPDQGDSDGRRAPVLERAMVLRAGTSLALVAWGRHAATASAVADTLLADGHAVHVLDLRSLDPLDREAVATAAKHCGRVLVLHSPGDPLGVAGRVTALLAAECFYSLDTPIVRCALRDDADPVAVAVAAARAVLAV